MNLNDFHRLNFQRMHEAFPPAHELPALVLCIQEEVGELSAAILGVTGEKARKKHLTNADILDACADAATYVSLALSRCGMYDLARALAVGTPVSPPPDLSLFDYARCAGTAVGRVAEASLQDDALLTATHLLLLWCVVRDLAMSLGCADFGKLLGETFNMVSDRAGSPIKVEV